MWFPEMWLLETLQVQLSNSNPIDGSKAFFGCGVATAPISMTLPTPPISSAAAGFRLHVVPDIIEEHQTTKRMWRSKIDVHNTLYKTSVR